MSTTINESRSTYFDSRMQALGITPEQNQVMVWRNNKDNQNELQPVPIFRPHDKGIEIIITTLARTTIRIEKDGSRMKKDWSIIRFEKPVVKADGNTMKYSIPKGQGSFPFFSPSIIDKYDAQTPIHTLFLTEGFFKAFKGCMHGIDVIGLASITHMKDRETGALHPDILRLITTCSVKRVVWLTDGDCIDITGKDLNEKIDLYKRPSSFFSSVTTFKQLLDDYDLDKYFVHIDIDSILVNESKDKRTRDQVKGLDDLLCSFPDRIPEIVEDMNAVSKPGQWFVKFNITGGGISKVKKHFHLDNATGFYSFHVDRRKDLKGKEFLWNGTMYRYNEEKAECEVMVPGDAKKYFRVGDQYYKHVEKPNKYKELEPTFERRQKGTIMDDHGKNFTKHIAKFEAFCNVPDHVNFQQYLYSCFNVYNPLHIHPEDEKCAEDDCPTIINYIKHIFGQNKIHFVHPVTKQKHEYENWWLGLDYIQLLYQQPTVQLPIVCLVSRENNTGKTTFGKLLKQIFGGNCAVVGNADLAGDFNAHWATKLLVICDETKIDKQHVVEKVKSLSTADKIMMNAKGKDHVELDCFIKFMFVTNNEENFIYATEEDIRYWVIKVPVVRQENPLLMDNMKEELPAFLSFLNNRKLVTERLNRMWFYPDLLKTPALKKVQEYSQSTIVKELRHYFREAFMDHGVEEILMTRKAIHKEVFNNKYEANYLEKALKEDLKVDTYHKLDPVEKDLFGEPKKIYQAKRHAYPRWEVRQDQLTRNTEVVRVAVQDTGRPYILKREMFLTPQEIASLNFTDENRFINDLVINAGMPEKQNGTYHEQEQPEQQDLPF